MRLSTTNDKLQLVLAGAITTNALEWVTGYDDISTSTFAVTNSAENNGTSNNTTDVDIIGAPGASTTRIPKFISIYNKDTVAATVTVKLDVSGTERILRKVSLATGETLEWLPETGWQVRGSVIAAAFSAHKNGVSQTGIPDVTFTKLTFTTEDFDVGGYYDSANSKWTPPAGVVELVLVTFVTTDITVGGATIAAIYKNGSLLKNTLLFGVVANQALDVNILCIDKCNGTDYYEAYIYINSAVSGTVDGTGAYTFFQGAWIGPA